MSTSRTDLAEMRGQAERFRIVQRISDDLAHELKNPLNALVINLEVLRTRVRAGHAADALERLDVLEQETRRLHVLLDHVLRLMRPEQLTDGPPEFPVAPLLAEVGTIASVLARSGRGSFALQPGDDAVLAAGRREPIRYALIALCEAASAGTAAEADVVRLAAVADGAGVTVTLTAPAGAAARLGGALPVAARLLAEEGIPLGAALDEDGCRVRIGLRRAGV